MSADIAVFHSAEADDPKLLPEGWYIAALRGDDFCLDECCVGPYATAELAHEAMASGEWLQRDNYFDAAAAEGIDDIAHAAHAGVAGGFRDESP